MSIVASVLGRLLASTELLAVLSVRSWLGVAFGSWIVYLASSSQLARPSRDAPCAPFGLVFRILYGLFGTRLAVLVLGRALHTRKTDPTPDQHGGTRPTIVGEPNLRVKIVPILGSAFGGNYAFLVWDEADEQRRAIVVDPSDPHVVLRAAEAEGLNVELLLCTHWHFDHSSGNGTFKRYIKRLQVVASAHERGYVPAVTRRLRDLEEIRLGRLVVRGHHAPGHTRGSMLFEVFNRCGRRCTPACRVHPSLSLTAPVALATPSPSLRTPLPSYPPPPLLSHCPLARPARATRCAQRERQRRAADRVHRRHPLLRRVRRAVRMLRHGTARFSAASRAAAPARDAPLPGARVHGDARQDGGPARAPQRGRPEEARGDAAEARAQGADGSVDPGG